MSVKKILTIFGATGKQGGSVIDVVLAHPELAAKYDLRGISRDPSSGKSKALASKGVEVVQGELDDLESLKKAVKGSYGVFGVTDFWSILDKQREIRQGKNIFDAAKAENVHHFVFSSLPYAEKLTKGELKHVDHFDSKAQVAEYAEANKGDMISSYVMPAMFIDFAKTMVNVVEGKPTLAMPFPSDDIAWPLIEPRRDLGKYVLAVFEAEFKANGVHVHAVSTWTTPKKVVAALSNEAGQEVVFKILPGQVFASFLPENIREELLETILLVGNYSYYGPGEEKNQKEHDKWLVPGSELISYEQWAKENGPWKY
ncbi:hypothetical protein M409DRAFT_49426 [Zasmidium cellare ATCC 36951]|uniref:NmrA-like domain-containing protein n=1 Tax=Zasmidium cellare ATCC 36951 TaxID=1080233 RepID=A0A6A6D165_ZASCE|nr:uncharacterized protein M409DRAFT_49426 [Zasmidium cellare ATCC 36951]KAF2172915.1 hypothetical protein M409DRAFT_49426 [Zasmidium cellare ATCC 36951]